MADQGNSYFETQTQENGTKLISDAPPSYSNLMGHSRTIDEPQNDGPPPYQPHDVSVQQGSNCVPHSISISRTISTNRSASVHVVITPPQANIRMVNVNYVPSRMDTAIIDQEIKFYLHFVFIMSFVSALLAPLVLVCFITSTCCICKAKNDALKGESGQAKRDLAWSWRLCTVGFVSSLVIFPAQIAIILGLSIGLNS